MKEQFKRDLKKLGVNAGSNLLIHASLKSLGPIPKDLQFIIQGIQEVIGEEGTLLMPALSYASVDESNPVFDLLKTPCCVGALPEYFRTYPGVVRSIHPTHSVSCLGKHQHLFTASHQEDKTPCGKHSPFHLLPKYNGKILMLGCGLHPNTSMHAIEEVANVSYLLKESIDYDIIEPENKVHKMSVRRHNFHGYYKQRYDRLEGLLHDGIANRGKVLQADCYLIDAKSMWDIALSTLEQDPLYFVEPE
jgi:aminoglycoside 3-N-acetyltransferase